MKQRMRNIAIVIFGLIFPAVVLIQAYIGITYLQKNVEYKKTVSELITEMSKLKKSISTANDYALFSLMYVEHANQKTMINKQIMKSSIIKIGFAVISIGMMLIMLGIQAKGNGGVEAAGGYSGLKFDLKTGSTGVAVFVAGALMATMGGVLKNKYEVSTIPMFESTSVSTKHPLYEQSLQAYRECQSQGKNFETCFAQFFSKINKNRLK